MGAEALESAGGYRWASTRAELSHAYLLPGLRRCLMRLGLSDKTVLDAGCGNGALTAAYADCIGGGLRAIDSSADGVAHAQELLGAGAALRASVCDDLSALFHGVRQWDAIVSAEVIEHLYDPASFVRRVHDALKPGGWLVLTTPYHGYLKNLAIAAAGKCDSHYNPLADNGHIKFWSRRTLTALLAAHGLETTDIVGVGRIPWLWKSMIACARKPHGGPPVLSRM